MAKADTLKATFDKFFGPDEDTHGTGYVSRDVSGTAQMVLVDEQEAADFDAQCTEEAQAEQDAFQHRVDVTYQVNH